MVAIADICNRALSEIGTQKQIASLADNTVQAQACAVWYDELRQQLLHAAHWGFARGQVVLTQLGDFNPNQTSPYPWQWKYSYPSTAIRMRYLLRQAPQLNANIPFVGQDVGPMWNMIPSRKHRYIVSSDTDPTSAAVSKVLLTNVPSAIGVFTADITDPNMFDPGFRSALIAMLAYKLVIPLSGNAGMRSEFKQTALQAIMEARAQDANESISTTDHTPDWIATRGVSTSNFGLNGNANWGNWTDGCSDINWGM